jgi:hypothetical protein
MEATCKTHAAEPYKTDLYPEMLLQQVEKFGNLCYNEQKVHAMSM